MATNIENTSTEDVQKLHRLLMSYCESISAIATGEAITQHINNAIKTLQTLRGSSSFMQWHIVELLAETNSKLLGYFRQSKNKPNIKTLKVIALSVKAMLEQLAHIEKNGVEKYKDYDKLIDMFEQLMLGNNSFTVRLSETKFNEIIHSEKPITATNAATSSSNDSMTADNKAIQQPAKDNDANIKQTKEANITDMQANDSEASQQVAKHIQCNESNTANHFFTHDNNKITLQLNTLTLLANIASCLDLLRDSMNKITTIECDAAGVNKPSTSLLQFLLCLHKEPDNITMKYNNISDEFTRYARFILGEESFV